MLSRALLELQIARDLIAGGVATAIQAYQPTTTSPCAERQSALARLAAGDGQVFRDQGGLLRREPGLP